MTKPGEGYESGGTTYDATTAGSGRHGGSSVKQGARAARGRDEFDGKGKSAAQDPSRTREGGCHYGRPAIDEPVPGGVPPGRPDLGDPDRADARGADADDEAGETPAGPQSSPEGRRSSP